MIEFDPFLDNIVNSELRDLVSIREFEARNEKEINTQAYYSRSSLKNSKDEKK